MYSNFNFKMKKKKDRSFKWIGGMVNVLQFIKKSKKGKIYRSKQLLIWRSPWRQAYTLGWLIHWDGLYIEMAYTLGLKGTCEDKSQNLGSWIAWKIKSTTPIQRYKTRLQKSNTFFILKVKWTVWIGRRKWDYLVTLYLGQEKENLPWKSLAICW